jgi:hypothetical protein
MPATNFDLQGVEKRAKDRLDMAGPQPANLIVNGGRPYAPKLPGTDIGGPPAEMKMPFMAPGAAAAPAAPTLPGTPAPRLAPRMPGTEIGEPRNPLGGMSPVSPLGGMPSTSPLGGMPTTSISSRGGPMSYSQQGVGTTSPMAYAVGRGRRDVGTRILERLARRGNAAAAGQLAGQTFQAQQTQGERGFTVARDRVRRADEMTDYQVRRGDEVADRESERTWQGQREDAQNRRRDDEYRIRRADELQDYGRQRSDEIADRDAESIVGDATLPVQGGSVPAVRTKGGGVKMAGGFMPTPKEAPDLSKYGNDPNLRIKSVDSTGKTVFERIDDKAEKPLIEWKDIMGTSTPHQLVTDPKTGEQYWRKMRVVDANGDGVVSPAEKAAAAAPAAAAETPKAPVKKAAGSNSFLGKVK